MTEFDLLCCSHLRWDFVCQRPQHLLTRCAKTHRVLYLEEPEFYEGRPFLEERVRDQGVKVLVPQLHHSLRNDPAPTLRVLLSEYLSRDPLKHPVLWYYTPMALDIARDLPSEVIVYDCMDELSLFAGASPELKARELELLARADLVFTGGQSLFEAKRGQHPRVFCFPSSVDAEHFRQARQGQRADPADQASIRGPRAGWFGVIDERMDLELLRKTAELRPDWQFVMIGPVCKIDPASLPVLPNLHYLGPKSYAELPDYLGHWQAAMMPFARNDATRFISPTKTPEYLAGGRPVISTSIRDVIVPYQQLNLVEIADDAETFSQALDRCLAIDSKLLWERADTFLAQMSWDETWRQMEQAIACVAAKTAV
jgi:glycosyltransferase involved in cell wall biosynthesis